MKNIKGHLALALLMAASVTSAGGFIWGDSLYGNCRVPNYSTGASTALNGSTARTYLFLGKAECRNGTLNLGKLVSLTNGLPQASGLFGNYSSSPTAAKLIQDDRVDSDGGQDFTILVVSPDRKNKLPPKNLVGGYTANFVAILTGTSESAVTSDGARYAKLVSDKATGVKDFIMSVPFVDVDGTTLSVY